MFLTDKFNRVHKYLRISLTEKCNLACNYCMPKEKESHDVVKNNVLTPTEIGRIAKIFRNLGVTKVRLTGGEPTVRSDFGTILEEINTIGFQQIGITTNGVLLNRYWDDLERNKVRLLNLSLDTLDGDKFEIISNKPKSFWKKTMENIEFAIALKESGKYDSIKVNVVVMRHVNDDEIISLVSWGMKYPIQLRFIELMPFVGNSYSSRLFFGKEEILGRLKSYFGEDLGCEAGGSLTSSTGDLLYKVRDLPGEIGIISSMTDAFCSSCDRLRLTADGNIRNCLFAKSELSLRDILRSDEANIDELLEKRIRESVNAKFKAHGGVSNILEAIPTGRPMISIGG